ncbi:anti-sigma F factor [Clostridium sp. CAG:465]|nr:anti-sigma F factor [Clostridium sp. CAG:465]
MEEINRMKIEIKAVLENVAIVRVAISSFISTLDITIDELMDIKTAISEAVTNSIEHGYDEVDDLENKSVIVKAYIYSDNDDVIKIEIEDKGVGIEDIETAMLPTYTSKPELEHAGMGFTIMETFMDEVLIDSSKNEGTKVTLTRRIKKKKSKVV